MTNLECITYIKDYLKSNKVKNIECDEDLITFRSHGIRYYIFIEDFETIHYGIKNIDDTELSEDFFIDMEEIGDYKWIDDFYHGVVKSRSFDYIKTIWKTLIKLDENDDQYMLPQIVREFFKF